MRLHAPYLPLGSLCKGPEYGSTRIRTQKLGGAIEVIENKSLIFTDEKAKFKKKAWLSQGLTAPKSRTSHRTQQHSALQSFYCAVDPTTQGLRREDDGEDLELCWLWQRKKKSSTLPENSPSTTKIRNIHLENLQSIKGRSLFNQYSDGTQDLWKTPFWYSCLDCKGHFWGGSSWHV